MEVCKYCGKLIPSTEKVCSNCGNERVSERIEAQEINESIDPTTSQDRTADNAAPEVCDTDIQKQATTEQVDVLEPSIEDDSNEDKHSTKEQLDDDVITNTNDVEEKNQSQKRVKWAEILGVLVSIVFLGVLLYMLFLRVAPKTNQEVQQVADTVVYAENGRYGLMDMNFNPITFLPGNASSQNSKGNMLVEENYKHIYLMDRTGKKLTSGHTSLLQSWGIPSAQIDGDYWLDYASSKGSLAFVDYDDDNNFLKSGIIDENGQIVIESDQLLFNQFSNGNNVTEFAKVQQEFDPFNYGLIFSDELIEYGVIDEKGNVIIEAEYSYIKVLSNDYFMVRDKEKYQENVFYVIDRNKNIMVEADPIDVEPFKNGMAAYYNYETGRGGVYNTRFEMVIDGKYDSAPAINEQGNILASKQDGTIELFNADGKLITTIENKLKDLDEPFIINAFPHLNGFFFEIFASVDQDGVVQHIQSIDNTGQTLFGATSDKMKLFDSKQAIYVSFKNDYIIQSTEDSEFVYNYKGEQLAKQTEILYVDHSLKGNLILFTEQGVLLYNREGTLLAQQLDFASPAGEQLFVQYKDGRMEFIERQTGKVLKSAPAN